MFQQKFHLPNSLNALSFYLFRGGYSVQQSPFKQKLNAMGIELPVRYATYEANSNDIYEDLLLEGLVKVVQLNIGEEIRISDKSNYLVHK